MFSISFRKKKPEGIELVREARAKFDPIWDDLERAKAQCKMERDANQRTINRLELRNIDLNQARTRADAMVNDIAEMQKKSH